MSQALVALFAPYCQGLTRRPELERALALLAHGCLEGARRLRPEGARPFQLHWQAAASPLELTQASLRLVDGAGQIVADYRFELPTHRLVLWLMDALVAAEAGGEAVDLPESFWAWLIQGLDPTMQAP
jgi:hypothetical protein